MKSTRKVGNICIGAGNLIACEDDTLLWITELFKEFGKNFKNVELNYVYISLSGLRTLLQLCPNLESLTMQSVTTVVVSGQVSDSVPWISRFTLSKSLRKVSMLYCNKTSQQIALEFMPGTIQTFEICSDDLQFLQEFFAQQKKIKSLTMKYYGEKIIVPQTVYKMKLQELSLVLKGYTSDDCFMTNIIKSQRLNLKVLDLSSSRISDETFLILCNVKKLETLKLVVNEVKADIFGKITSLVNLKELTVIKNDGVEDMTHLYSLTSWCYRNKLRKLEILYPTMTIKETIYIPLAEAMPDLEDFTINSALSGSMIVNIVYRFKVLKSLKLQDARPFCMPELEFCLLNNISYVNRNMQELTLKLNLIESWKFIEAMIKCFPHLRKLEFETSIQGSDFDVMLGYILQELNLRELIIFNHALWEIKDGEATHILRCKGQRMKLVQLNATATSLDFRSLFGKAFVEVSLSTLR